VISRERAELEGMPVSSPDPETPTLERLARAEFEEFAAYVAGETFGYIVGGESSDPVDSCFGFYGLEYCRESARESAEYAAGERARLRALPWLPTFGNRKGGGDAG